ncbi:hypothetical protein [Phaeobacter sp. B1627]|uniref:hypothetical protein n=1 Tax=Phaeobacter sp. B1627 TaxID=2583809 RepID=UPI0011185EEE|nr:hypothetical protein [Phaeobacter sp. B1627]TNJ43324.1 hypothetical protein FGE21_09565 [Phaeobacter sp. B1627]
MQTEVTRLREISIFPFYSNLPIEVAPVLTAASGRYINGRIMNHQFCELILDAGVSTDRLRVGAPYSCSGVNADGQTVQTHWLYCTSTGPRCRFGMARDWCRAAGFAPLLADASAPLVKLEELTDLVTVFPALPPAVGLSQAQIGLHGWLVMTCLTVPHMMGIQIDDPALPPALSEGVENITISARCSRTMQSIGVDGLTCVAAQGSALFLREQG